MTDQPYEVPIRQWEMLEAIAAFQDVPQKNAATRKALEDRGFIRVIDRDSWTMEATEEGLQALWERAEAVAPDDTMPDFSPSSRSIIEGTSVAHPESQTQQSSDISLLLRAQGITINIVDPTQVNHEETPPMEYLLDKQYIDPWKLTQEDFKAWREAVALKLATAHPYPDAPDDAPEIEDEFEAAAREVERLAKVLTAAQAMYKDGVPQTTVDQHAEAVVRRDKAAVAKAELDRVRDVFYRSRDEVDVERIKWIHEHLPHLLNTVYIPYEGGSRNAAPIIKLDFLNDFTFHARQVKKQADYNREFDAASDDIIPDAVQADYPHFFKSIAPKPVTPAVITAIPKSVPTSVLKINDSLRILFEDAGSVNYAQQRSRKVRMNVMNGKEDQLGTFLSTELHLSQVDMMIEKLTAIRAQMLPGGEPASAAPSNDNLAGAA